FQGNAGSAAGNPVINIAAPVQMVNSVMFPSPSTTISGSADLTFSGTFNLGGNSNLLTVNNFGFTNFAGKVTGTGQWTLASTTANAGGQIILSNSGNDYTGGTTLNSGLVTLGGNTNPLGTGPVVINAAAIQDAGNSPTLNNLIFNNAAAANPATFAGTNTLSL